MWCSIAPMLTLRPGEIYYLKSSDQIWNWNWNWWIWNWWIWKTSFGLSRYFVATLSYFVGALTPIAASILFSSSKNGIKIQFPNFFFHPEKWEKKFPPSFHPSPHLDFEINSPPGASRTISTLKCFRWWKYWFQI